mgnify:CR=1 FL=1
MSSKTPELNDLIGKPFVFKGRGEQGYDCWGLVLKVFHRFGIEIPDYSVSAETACEDSDVKEISSKFREEESNNSNWKKLSKPEVPCIVLLRINIYFSHHVGVYLGYGKFIHSHRSCGVNIERTTDVFWKNNVKGYYIYVGR